MHVSIKNGYFHFDFLEISIWSYLQKCMRFNSASIQLRLSLNNKTVSLKALLDGIMIIKAGSLEGFSLGYCCRTN